MNVLPFHPRSSNTRHPVEEEPTAAELAAVEAEMSLIAAEVELLDAQIAILDRPTSELDARRIRRAETRVLAARRDAANLTTSDHPEVA